MSAYIDVLADELETEAQVAGAERYTRGEIGYHAYVRRYLALLAARRIADLEQQVARLLDEATPQAPAPVLPLPLRKLDDTHHPSAGAGEKEAASHHNRGAR